MALSCLAAVRSEAQSETATADDGGWRYEVALPLWAAGLDGDVSFKGIPEQHVSASFGDLISNFDIGLLGHFEARRNRLALGADLVYFNLGADVGTGAPVLGRLDLEADLRQLIAEAFVAYRLTRGGGEGRRQGFADVILGTRYYGIRTQISGEEFAGTRRTFDFVDGMAGLRGFVPLGTRWGLRARADIAGLGSDVTWNLASDLGLAVSEHWTIEAGYRYLDIDYERGEGLDRNVYAMKTKGPVLTIRVAW